MRNGLGSVWVQCPLAVAVKVAPNGNIRIGWSTARVELMRARPRQCFRCWQPGHMKSMCKAETDRSGACFRCGREGHTARQCTMAPLCVLCEQAGRNANHRRGSGNCATFAAAAAAGSGPRVRPGPAPGTGATRRGEVRGGPEDAAVRDRVAVRPPLPFASTSRDMFAIPTTP